MNLTFPNSGKFLNQVWSRDLSNFLQDGLETLTLSGFDNLLLSSQKSRYLQRKIKPFQVILQIFGRISAQYLIDSPCVSFGKDEE
ncbi:MAG: hypothetical protein RM049_27755 [Nostoc sp. DedQUE04]|uniref:hypothetical protein n=1 Tax=Nostoc sp. DedQUE04 TaxID=3075390 RepID=UPI002AD4A3F6|nr:hypothetical protein [Nostoc sp. DedQUE04]MDZ8139031.1 hypothetical protein [Nostoc sp. DedQUE04]